MIKYILEKEKYNKKLSLVIVSDIDIFAFYKNAIENLINYFNQEYTWDKMFNIDNVEERIRNGERLFLLYYDNTAVGYVFFKHIDEQTCFGYNLYVTKIINRPKDSAYWFYNEASGAMLNTYKFIKVEIEDWNQVVLDMVKKIGYEKEIIKITNI